MKAFIFTGQGNEYTSMAKELYEDSSYAKEFIDNLNIDFDYKKIFVEESPLIHDTRYSQIGNFVISIILAKMLGDNGIKASASLGLSLGEYTALCYANALSVHDTLEILQYRSNIMYEALNNKDTGMMAVMFLDSNKIEEIVNKFDNVWIANYNSPVQTVIAGDNKELDKCANICMENGAKKIVKLDVIGAFHTKLLKDASNKLKKILDKYEINNTEIPIYYNYTGDKSSDDIEELLVNQLYNPVKFERCILNMIRDGIDEFYVIGVGKSIDNFIRSIALNNKSKVSIIHIEKVQDIEDLKNE